MDKSTQINVCTFCLGDKRTTLVNEPTPPSYSLSSSSSSQLVAATATESKSLSDYYTTTNTKAIPTTQKQQQKNQTKSASNGASSKKKADLKLTPANSIKYEYDDYGTTNLASAYHPKKKFISNSHYNN